MSDGSENNTRKALAREGSFMVTDVEIDLGEIKAIINAHCLQCEQGRILGEKVRSAENHLELVEYQFDSIHLPKPDN